MRFPRVAALVIAAAPGTALAGTAGIGAAGDTARSLSSNPALAIGARGTELAADVQSTLVFLTYQRLGTNPQSGERWGRERSFVHGEIPYLAIRSDVFRVRDLRGHSDRGNVGLGFSLSLPFSSGARYRSDSGGRYHVIDATTFSVYLAPAVALKPVPSVRVGVAPVLAISRLSVTRSVDLAPSLSELLGEPVDPEQALLEGGFRVKDATGVAPTYQAGVAWDFARGRGTAGLSYTGGTLVTLRGRSRFTPSHDFNVSSVADFQYVQYLPPIANAGVRWHFTRDLEGSFEAQWIGWSASRKAVSRLENSRIESSQEDLQAFLDFFEINQGQLVEGILDKEQTTVRGSQNAWNAVAGVDYAMEPVRVRVEAGFFSRATPDRYVSTSNLDFDNFTIGAGAAWEPSRRFSLGLYVNQFINGGRRVRNSAWDGSKSNASGLAYPSGNGDYDVSATRVNLMSHVRFQ